MAETTKQHGVPGRVPVSGGASDRAGNLKGIGWMLLSGILFVGVTGIVRHLGTDMSPIQAAFIRYAFGLVLVIPLLLRLGGGTWLFSGLFSVGRARRRLGLHALRGLIHGIGVMLWFYAMEKPIFQGFDTAGCFPRNGHKPKFHCGPYPMHYRL